MFGGSTGNCVSQWSEGLSHDGATVERGRARGLFAPREPGARCGAAPQDEGGGPDHAAAVPRARINCVRACVVCKWPSAATWSSPTVDNILIVLAAPGLQVLEYIEH